MPAKPAKTSTRHPYAAIDHRVIDSPAYAALTYSARSVLTLLTRQLTKDNNGHLQATFKYMSEHGIDSERTLSRGVKELIAHGFIYRTRTGGYQQGASQYAVTWLSITKRNDIFLDGFAPCAWREWTPADKKTPPAKLQSISGKNGILTPSAHAKNAASTPRKNADNEYVPCRVVKAALSEPLNNEPAKGKDTGDPLNADDDYQRTRDDAPATGVWSESLGEFVAVRPSRKLATVLHRRSL